MPTERFYRLPKMKADTIRRAAIEEFKRVSPEEASINRIIQAAEISRGSFYTYFEDKYDLLKWVIGDFIGDYRKFYITGLKANGGNLWELFDQVLEHTIHWVDEQGLVEIVGNMMKGTFFVEHMNDTSGHKCEMEKENSGYAETIYELVNPDCCALDFEEFQELLNMHVAALVVALKKLFGDRLNPKEIQDAYRRRMKLLRYGACPGREQDEIE